MPAWAELGPIQPQLVVGFYFVVIVVDNDVVVVLVVVAIILSKKQTLTQPLNLTLNKSIQNK